jgi:hypothetical protein
MAWVASDGMAKCAIVATPSGSRKHHAISPSGMPDAFASCGIDMSALEERLHNRRFSRMAECR